MACSGIGPFEFLTRPYPYKREPFQLTLGELITYEGIYFSIPGSGLMLDKRLFTDASSHPVDSSIKLYINKDSALSPVIEPDDDGAVYTSGTPHYGDYILDLRALIDEVTSLHAADTDHTARQFFEDHLRQRRTTYDFTGKTIADGEYVHPDPSNIVPSGATPPGSSGSIPPPGDGFELGAQQIMDIDMDEIQWQALARPKKRGNATPGIIPVEPIFPMALPQGSLPTFTTLDDSHLNDLALNGSTSGGVLVTGDALVAGSSIKLSTNSGVTPDGEGNFVDDVPWKLFPCERELCRYYTPIETSGVITARGRQGIFAAPGSLSSGVYLLAASASTDTSGLVTQHWPGNYHGTSGIDANGHAHDGVHVVDKLIYNLNSLGGGNTAVGHSPLNGKKVLVHWRGGETGSQGETFTGAGPKYHNGDTVYAAGSIVNPRVTDTESTANWATVSNLFSPVSWATLSTTALGPTITGGGSNSITYGVGDIQAGSTRGVITRKAYAQWGFIDQLVAPDFDRATGGQRITKTITYTTHSYSEGTDGAGNFEWVEDDDSPYTSTTELAYFDNTYFVNNIFSFFFLKKPNNGLVHANGDIYVQWSNKTGATDVLPRRNFFAIIGAPQTGLKPSTNRSDVTISIGFFPSWALRRYVTTNNQVSVPTDIALSPANSEVITFDSALDFDESVITDFGPPVWDADVGVNYIYFLATIGGLNKLFFAHMDTDFMIFRINQTDGDGFLTGRAALLSI